jgi:Zn-dependent protease with chaperone function
MFASDALIALILRPRVAFINKPTKTVGIITVRFSLIAIALLLMLSSGMPSASAQNQKQNEIARAESGFTGKSFGEINLLLAAMRPAPVSGADKSLLMRDLPLVADSNKVEGQHQLGRLYARLDPVLKLCGRYGVVDLIVFRNSQPIVYSKPGVVLVISTEVLKIVGNDDAALAGIVAHELAHEYVALQMLGAIRSRDLSKIRELELFCDAVAVVVLLDLGLDPTHYAKALQRIATHSQAATILNDGSNSHPEIEARLKVISDISDLALVGRRSQSKQDSPRR